MNNFLKQYQQKILEELRKRVIEKDKFLKEKNESKDILKANKEALLEMTDLSEEEVDLIEKEIQKEFENKHYIIHHRKKRIIKYVVTASLIVAVALVSGLYLINRLDKDKNNFIDYKKSSNLWKTNSWNSFANFSPKDMEINCFNCNHAQWFQEFNLKPNTFYNLSFLIKIENVDSICDTKDAGSIPWGANVWVYRKDPRLSHELRFYGTSDWQEGQLNFNTGEVDNVTIHLQIGGHGGLTKGKAWFKNISLKEI